jgi:hypothetical protein
MRVVFTVVREAYGWTVLLLFWLRELAGWVLLVLGLFVFYQCFALLLNTTHIIQVGPLMFLGFIIFRAGIHLLKVSAAALVCLRTQEQLDDGPRRASSATRPPLRTAPFELGPRNPPV